MIGIRIHPQSIYGTPKDAGLVVSVLEIPFRWTAWEQLTVQRILMNSFVYPKPGQAGGPYVFEERFRIDETSVENILARIAVESAFSCLAKIYEARDQKTGSVALDFVEEIIEASDEIESVFSLLRNRRDDLTNGEIQSSLVEFLPGTLELLEDTEAPNNADGKSPLQEISKKYSESEKFKPKPVISLNPSEVGEYFVLLHKKLPDKSPKDSLSERDRKVLRKKKRFDDEDPDMRPIVRFTHRQHEFRSIILPYVRFDSRANKLIGFAENGQFMLPKATQLPKLMDVFETVLKDQNLGDKDQLAKHVNRGSVLNTRFGQLPNTTFSDDENHRPFKEVYKDMALHFFFGCKEIAISNFSEDGFFDKSGIFLAYRKDIILALRTGSNRTDSFRYLTSVSNLKKLISTIADWMVFSNLFEQLDRKIEHEAKLLDGSKTLGLPSLTYGDTFAASFKRLPPNQERIVDFIVGNQLEAKKKDEFSNTFDRVDIGFEFDPYKGDDFSTAICNALELKTKEFIWSELKKHQHNDGESRLPNFSKADFDAWVRKCVGDTKFFSAVALSVCEDEDQKSALSKMLGTENLG